MPLTQDAIHRLLGRQTAAIAELGAQVDAQAKAQEHSQQELIKAAAENERLGKQITELELKLDKLPGLGTE